MTMHIEIKLSPGPQGMPGVHTITAIAALHDASDIGLESAKAQIEEMVRSGSVQLYIVDDEDVLHELRLGMAKAGVKVDVVHG